MLIFFKWTLVTCLASPTINWLRIPPAALLYVTICSSTGSQGRGRSCASLDWCFKDINTLSSSCVSYQLYKDQLAEILTDMRMLWIIWEKRCKTNNSNSVASFRIIQIKIKKTKGQASYSMTFYYYIYTTQSVCFLSGPYVACSYTLSWWLIWLLTSQCVNITIRRAKYMCAVSSKQSQAVFIQADVTVGLLRTFFAGLRQLFPICQCIKLHQC